MRGVRIVDPRDLNSVVGAWRRDPVTIFPAVNTLFNGLANFPAFSRLDFSGLRLCFGGGAAVQRAVAANLPRITGRPLLQGTGMSATSPTVWVHRTDGNSSSGGQGLTV